MASSKSSSSDSLCGLSFGKKIYFEDGNGSTGNGGGGGSSKGSVKKGKAAAAVPPPAPPPPRCQVEGCNVDLTGAKAYYCRHKVCGMHSKTAVVIVAGLEQRFCQQCSRFHQLSEFDQGKRSCRRRLAGHNERRRKPPPMALSSRYARMSTSLHDDPNRVRSFRMDFSYLRPPGVREIWPTARGGEYATNHQCYGNFNALSTAVVTNGSHPYIPPPVEGLAGVSDSSCALSLLSNHPWGNNNGNAASRNPCTNLITNSSYENSPVTQHVISNNNYAANYWGGFRGHGLGGNSHEIQHEIGGISHLTGAENGQFSSELELALQGSRACDHPCHVMHWSF